MLAVHTSHGTVHPGAVVFATGLAPQGMVSMPQLLVKGHLCTTEPAPFRLDASITDRAGGIAIGQLPDGRILTGGDRSEDDGRGVDPGLIGSFRERLVGLLPEAAGLEISHAWSCRRPATPDRWPLVDRVAGLDNAWLTAAHYATGILLAPEVAAALAGWIETGEAPDSIEPFRASTQGPRAPLGRRLGARHPRPPARDGGATLSVCAHLWSPVGCLLERCGKGRRRPRIGGHHTVPGRGDPGGSVVDCQPGG